MFDILTPFNTIGAFTTGLALREIEGNTIIVVMGHF